MQQYTDILVHLKQTSLYIHIPFCIKKCSYCDFYSCKLGTESEIQSVLNRILEDTVFFLESLGNPEVRTLFIGGGTPSSIPSHILRKFLEKLNIIINIKPYEYSIELNPETVTREVLSILEENSINRISLGVQSLDDRVLKVLGRNTNSIRTLKALETIKKYWTKSFSADLINAVPEQTLKIALSDIRQINYFKPDHISLYSLTFEAGTKLFSRLEIGKIQPIKDSDDIFMQKESINLLKSMGFNRYEVSNFAKNGKESLHNLNYWKMGSYLGIGPSGASTLLTNAGPLRLSYKRSISNFLNSKTIADRTEQELINPESFLLEHLMMGFRLKNGIDIEHINSVFNLDIEDYLKTVIGKWRRVIKLTETSIYLNSNGLALLNPFLVDVASLISMQKLKIRVSEINWPQDFEVSL
ncbi:MAG: radical SAM family heme chaperone HemW [Spirochaetaceae bacterium]|nr:radical SAM family heme chaperone HemW [Spirochaetaceae bacterium]